MFYLLLSHSLCGGGGFKRCLCVSRLFVCRQSPVQVQRRVAISGAIALWQAAWRCQCNNVFSHTVYISQYSSLYHQWMSCIEPRDDGNRAGRSSSFWVRRRSLCTVLRSPRCLQYASSQRPATCRWVLPVWWSSPAVSWKCRTCQICSSRYNKPHFKCKSNGQVTSLQSITVFHVRNVRVWYILIHQAGSVKPA